MIRPPALRRSWAAQRHQLPDRDRREGVTTLKCATAHGPRFLTGSSPPESNRPLPLQSQSSTTVSTATGGLQAGDRFFLKCRAPSEPVPAPSLGAGSQHAPPTCHPKRGFWQFSSQCHLFAGHRASDAASKVEYPTPPPPASVVDHSMSAVTPPP